MEEIRKSFRENEITRYFWKRGICIFIAILAFSYGIVTVLLGAAAYSDTTNMRVAVAERFLSGEEVNDEWFKETFQGTLKLEYSLGACTNKGILVLPRAEKSSVCDGEKELAYSIVVAWKDILDTTGLVYVFLASTLLMTLIVWSDWRGFVEKGEFYNFDGQILGTKLENAYSKLMKDIVSIESDNFAELSSHLYFLLKQDVWIQNRDKEFYMKVTNAILMACDKNLMYDESEIFFVMQKSLEREIFIKKKKYKKYVISILSLMVSKHFISAWQLFVFLILFTFLNSTILGMIIDSGDMVRNFHDTLAALNNTGANIEYPTAYGYAFGIYLQLAGGILFGTFINVLQMKIKR